MTSLLLSIGMKLNRCTRGKKMIKLASIPSGLDEIYRNYGDPQAVGAFQPDEKWQEHNLVWVEAPYPLILPWRERKPCNWLYLHKFVAPAAIDALKEIADYKGVDYLVKNKLDRYGGSFHFRKMSGYDALSTHSWGIAIDLNPDIACQGCGPETQPKFIVDAFKKRGFDWGGDWGKPYTCDPMHFQGAFSY